MTLEPPSGHRPTPTHHFSGDTQAERTAYWAAAARKTALDFEERARAGDPVWSERPWVRGHLIDWWAPEVEHLKRTGQFVLALDLAWECMEACERATFDHNIDLYTPWAQEVAIVARKMRNFDLEVQVCERVLDIDAFSQPIRDRWEKRLLKAEQLRAKAST